MRSASRSPRSSTRARTSSAVKVSSCSSSAASTSSHVSGVEAVGRARPRSEYGRDGGLGGVVLAPVDEDPVAPLRLGHHGGHPVRGLRGQPLGQRLGVARRRAGVVGADRAVELHALRPRRLGERGQPVLVQHRAQPDGDPGAVHDGRAGPGIEVEHQPVRGIAHRPVRDRPLRNVQFERGEVGSPHQRGQVVQQRVVDGARALAGPGTAGGQLDRAQPVRCVRGRVLLVERFRVDAVGVADERHRPVHQVRQQDRRDPAVVVDHLALGEPVRRVQHLVQVGQSKPPVADLHRDPLSP